jgi:hypothetical protein
LVLAVSDHFERASNRDFLAIEYLKQILVITNQEPNRVQPIYGVIAVAQFVGSGKTVKGVGHGKLLRCALGIRGWIAWADTQTIATLALLSTGSFCGLETAADSLDIT